MAKSSAKQVNKSDKTDTSSFIKLMSDLFVGVDTNSGKTVA